MAKLKPGCMFSELTGDIGLGRVIRLGSSHSEMYPSKMAPGSGRLQSNLCIGVVKTNFSVLKQTTKVTPYHYLAHRTRDSTS